MSRVRAGRLNIGATLATVSGESSHLGCPCLEGRRVQPLGP